MILHGLVFIQVLVFSLFLFVFVGWFRFPSLSAESECFWGVFSLFTASFVFVLVEGVS